MKNNLTSKLPNDALLIEDELHFVMKCPVYDQIRRDWLPNIDFDIATADTFYSLFNISEQQVLSLAKYVYNAFIMRENILKEMNA